jgi:anti-anti-sigma regulatory factor
MRTEASPGVVVDSSGVPYIDSAELGAVVGAYGFRPASTAQAGVSGMNERVRALLSMTHVSQLHTTLEEAERAMLPPT